MVYCKLEKWFVVMCLICAHLYFSSPWERISGQASETDESTKVS